ncbi:MAG: DUF3108 domain-containing protein [Saprospiraceae bacterium]|nr:DUF3108 domain-containing protein [Saprospiraceae bacterium]
MNILKTKRTWLLLTGVMLSVVSFLAFTGKSEINDECYKTNTSFKNGETLVYKVYYNWQFVWLSAGEVTMNLRENADSYEVRVYGNTYESYDYFFKVRDYFYTKIDKQTLLPKNFVRIIQEGDYRLYDSIAFQQNTLSAISFHGKSKETAVKKQFALNECMHDLVSILYSLRNTDTKTLVPGTQLPVKVFFDKEIYPVKLIYRGKEKNKKIRGLGNFNTLQISPFMVAGTVFKNSTEMKIWVSDDNNKIPLLIESPLSVGTGKAILKSYTNLRNSVTSKVN